MLHIMSNNMLLENVLHMYKSINYKTSSCYFVGTWAV